MDSEDHNPTTYALESLEKRIEELKSLEKGEVMLQVRRRRRRSGGGSKSSSSSSSSSSSRPI